MNRNYKTLCMIISALSFVSACSDDGSTSSTQPQDTSRCTESSECTENKVCHNEKCMIEAHEGDDCSDKETTFCANSECIDDICKVSTPVDKKECEKDSDCSGELVCTENKCMEPGITPRPKRQPA